MKKSGVFLLRELDREIRESRTGVWGIRDGEAAVLNFILTDYPELETWLAFSQAKD